MNKIKTYLFVAALTVSGILGLSAVPAAHATYAGTAYYCFFSNYYDAYSSYWHVAAVDTGSSTHRYNSFAYANSAYGDAYNAWMEAPSGSNTEAYAYQAWLASYYQAFYSYYNYIYGGGYDSQQADYDLQNDYYRGMTNYYTYYRF